MVGDRVFDICLSTCELKKGENFYNRFFINSFVRYQNKIPKYHKILTGLSSLQRINKETKDPRDFQFRRIGEKIGGAGSLKWKEIKLNILFAINRAHSIIITLIQGGYKQQTKLQQENQISRGCLQLNTHQVSGVSSLLG